VAVVTDGFLADALSSAQDCAMPAIRIVPLPAKTWYTARTQEPRMKEVAAAAFDAIIDALKRPLTAVEAQGGTAASRTVKRDNEILKYTGATYEDASEALYKDFLERHWSDGLPFVPPTREAVKQMLAGTSRSPDEVIGIVPAKNGKATIRVLAINAVMAGAKPEYLPVIIAAMEAITGGKLNALHLQASAGCVNPLILINGPIVAELGINAGSGYMGHGFRANNSIGRAVRLSLINCGHMWPGQNDMCLLGRQAAFGNMTFGENERDSPWKPYHVEMGFQPEQSTVTVVNTMHSHRGPGAAGDPIHAITLDQSLDDLAKSMSIVSVPSGTTAGEIVIAMEPSFAEQLSERGLSKEDVKSWLFQHARIPYADLRDEEKANLKKQQGGKTENIPDIPRVRKPEEIHIMVVGSSPGLSMIWNAPSGQETKAIRGATLTKAGR
jgi:hypothetical protein